jgi:hypothetical protein
VEYRGNMFLWHLEKKNYYPKIVRHAGAFSIKRDTLVAPIDIL